MLENMILEHNGKIAIMEQDIEVLRYELESTRREGDGLKFDEISAFMHENKLECVWFLTNHFDTIYGGKFFDFNGLRKKLTAIGTADGKDLIQLMSNIFHFEKKSTVITYDGDDSKIISILSFTLKK